MAHSGAVFEPKVIKAILKQTLEGAFEKKEFNEKWTQSVKKRVEGWNKKAENRARLQAQLQWEAEVVEYVTFVSKRTSVNGNSSGKVAPSLRADIPLLGPRFVPPTFFHAARREGAPKLSPKTTYLIPLTIIHPLYYPNLLAQCPQCSSKNISWDSWTATGGRDVHGIRREERALGYQLRCKDCAAKPESEAPEGYCFATTNRFFWEKWKHWRLPRSIPIFLSRTAVTTHELFDLLTELRPSSTSAGLAEHIKQLHLLEYWQDMLDYVDAFEAATASSQTTLTPLKLEELPNYNDTSEYNGRSISSDLITDIYLEFINKSRREESTLHCKSRKAKSISMDNTFKSAGKAVVVEKDGTRVKLMKGGILSAINEESETLSWRFCQSSSPAEIGEVLEGIAARFKELGISDPSVIVDNCCQVRNKIKAAMPGVSVILDVYHFMCRYLAVVVNGAKNPHLSQVAKSIRDAIIKTPASKGKPATYWPQNVQVQRLESAYKQWSENGDVWNASAAKHHLDQMGHVKKGCLARPREDIAMDGSRIEGSHKGWNSLQRAQPSGIEVYEGLGQDHILRRNIRIARARLASKTSSYTDDFIALTAGSHHIGLVDAVASSFNASALKSKSKFVQLATQRRVDSPETFGLVHQQNLRYYTLRYIEINT